MADQAYDWKGEAGDKFAAANPSSAEGQEKEFQEFFKQSAKDVFGKALEDLKANGFPDLTNAKVLDVGCSSGGKLAIMEKLGFDGKNIYGVDMSPKAIEILKENHPSYNAKEVAAGSCDYNVFGDDVDFDLVYHSAVFCQIPEEEYETFFNGIKGVAKKYYMFLEGIRPAGPKKIPNSVMHEFHDDKHGHGHDHGHGHGHGHGQHGHGTDAKTIDLMEEGYHYVDNLETVVAKYMPGAKQISRQILHYQDGIKKMFTAMEMEYFMAAVYKM